MHLFNIINYERKFPKALLVTFEQIFYFHVNIVYRRAFQMIFYLYFCKYIVINVLGYSTWTRVTAI